jgi:hypothetical protein
MTTTERGLFEQLDTAEVLHNARGWRAKQICAEFEQHLSECEASNQAVEQALDDVEYSGSYADGVLALKQRLAEAEQSIEDLESENGSLRTNYSEDHKKWIEQKGEANSTAVAILDGQLEDANAKIAQLEGVVAEKNQALAWALNCIDNPTDESPSAFVDGYHRAEKALALTAAQPAEQQEKCGTCDGHGMIGGFVNAESGYQSDPCPDCSKQEQPGAWREQEQEQEQEQRIAERQRKIMEHDYPTYRDFFHKYAVGSKLPPSCLCCGQSMADRNPGIKHLELADIVICEECHVRATQPQPGAAVPEGWKILTKAEGYLLTHKDGDELFVSRLGTGAEMVLKHFLCDLIEAVRIAGSAGREG